MEDQIRETIEGLDDDDFLELKQLVDKLYSQKQDEFEKKKAKKMMQQLHIGANVLVQRGDNQIEAMVVGMTMDGLQVEAEGYQRKVGIKYADVIQIL